MKGGRRHGFLCQSHASTSVCIPADSRSVVIPRRPAERALTSAPPKLADVKYSRLVQSGRYSTGAPPRTHQIKKLVLGPNVSNHVLQRPERTLETSRATNAGKPVFFPPPPPPKPPVVATTAPATHGNVFQIVVMRVSIHCQGCAYKLKKHISKMEGVTSFSIDLETKRVTVMGHISPLGVLENISKIKKAEFWQG